MLKYLSIILILFIYSCSSTIKEVNDSNSVDDKLKEKIIGIWTNGTTENATFNLEHDSIYYVDDFVSYRYSLEGDSIKINYSDLIYSGQISFIKDTLIMKSKESTFKFWKFIN